MNLFLHIQTPNRFSFFTLRCSSDPTKIPARDRVIDFGKHKGKLLGTLPSRYLKWVSQNLRARDFLHWAELADQVLRDPVYQDRVEWELAQSLPSGNGELLGMSERFGWDEEDRDGWRRVNFETLGTSKSGRIPRKTDELKKVLDNGMEKEGEVEKRRERRERMRLRRRDEKLGEEGRLGNGENLETRFPGREGLLQNVRKRFF